MLTRLTRIPQRAATKARGFTLIELLITFTLIGILVTLGLPSFTQWIRNSQIRSVAEALQNGLRLAQTEAVRRNQAVVINFTNAANPEKDPVLAANGKNWSIQTISSPLIAQGATEFIRAGVFSDVASGVAVTSTPAGVKSMCFNANGRLMTPTSSATNECPSGSTVFFEVTQTNADRPLKVYVEIGGKVRMCDPKRPTLSDTTPDGCPA
jgi:type IV fimbrial biogenesis protein FimT